MEGMKLIPYIALIIAIAGIILGASAVTLGKFGDTVDKCYNSSYVYNSTDEVCISTHTAATNGTNITSEPATIHFETSFTMVSGSGSCSNGSTALDATNYTFNYADFNVTIADNGDIWNETIINCTYNYYTVETPATSSANGYTNMTDKYYAIHLAGNSEVDIAEQIPTVAIIAVMTIIISIISGVFIYMRYFS